MVVDLPSGGWYDGLAYDECSSSMMSVQVDELCLCCFMIIWYLYNLFEMYMLSFWIINCSSDNDLSLCNIMGV